MRRAFRTLPEGLWPLSSDLVGDRPPPRARCSSAASTPSSSGTRAWNPATRWDGARFLHRQSSRCRFPDLTPGTYALGRGSPHCPTGLWRDDPATHAVRTPQRRSRTRFAWKQSTRVGLTTLLRSGRPCCARARRRPFLTWEWLHRVGPSRRHRVVRSRRPRPRRACDRAVRVAPPALPGSPGSVPGTASRSDIRLIVRAAATRCPSRHRPCPEDQLMTLGSTPAGACTAGARRAAEPGWTRPPLPTASASIPLRATPDPISDPAPRIGHVRRRLRASRAFQTRFELSRPARAHHALEALAASRTAFKEPGRVSASSAELRAQDEATRPAPDRGCADVRLRRTRDRAVMYGFSQTRHFYFYQHCFGRRYSRHSIGLV